MPDIEHVIMGEFLTSMPRYVRFINGRVFKDTGLLADELWIDQETGKIINASSEALALKDVETIDVDERIISPGFIDVQINGAFGFDFSGLDPNMSISEFEQSLHETNQLLIKTGTTSYLPTMTSQFETTYHKVRRDSRNNIVPCIRLTGYSLLDSPFTAANWSVPTTIEWSRIVRRPYRRSLLCPYTERLSQSRGDSQHWEYKPA